MRVLFIARNVPLPGYPENDIILQFASRLRARGVQVDLVFPAEWVPIPRKLLQGKAAAIAALGDRFTASGFDVRVVRYVRLPTARLSYLLTRWFWPRPSLVDFDFIHAHHVLPDGAMAHALAEEGGLPVVITVRQGDTKKMSQLPVSSAMHQRFRSVLARAALVLSPSKVAVSKLAQSDIEVLPLPHGIDDPGTGIGISEIGEELTVAAVGNLIPQKRVDWVVRAVGEYKGKRRVRVVHAGDGPERAAVQRLASELGVNLTLLGKIPREQVFALLRQSAIFSLPSHSETFGLVYLEAAISGCAVLGLAGSGVDGYFEQGREMCFSPDSYEQYREWLWRLLDDEEFRRSVAKAGTHRTRQEYLWDAVIARYESLTAPLLGKR